MDSNMNYSEFVSGMGGVGSNIANGFSNGNVDLDQCLFDNQPGAPFGSNADDMNGIYHFGGLVPNIMNENGGMAVEDFTQNNMFQSNSSHAPPQYDPQSSGFPFAQQSATDIPYGQPQQPQQTESPSPKQKRTRRSKKKAPTKEETEKKREEFLERNRVAASKCRNRKKEYTDKLQQSAHDLSIENARMKDTIMDLQAETMQLVQMVAAHRNCESPEFQAQLAQYQSIARNRSNYRTSMGSPDMSMGTLNAGPVSWGMQRTESFGSATSRTAKYKPDGTLNLLSPYLTNEDLKRANLERRAKDHAYMETYKMSRQNSDASSKTTNASTATGHEAEGYASSITTPEEDKSVFPEVPLGGRTRRGLHQKTLENPRSPQQRFPVDPSLSLRRLQNPSDFIAQQQMQQ